MSSPDPGSVGAEMRTRHELQIDRPETAGPKDVVRRLLSMTRTGRMFLETRATQTPVAPGRWLRQKLNPSLRDVYWPIHPSSLVQNPRRILIGIETSPGLMPGCYLQGLGGIIIGDYTQV